MSIVRVGLAETKKFAEGYEAIFGKKKSSSKGKTETSATKKKSTPKKKSTKKK